MFPQTDSNKLAIYFYNIYLFKCIKIKFNYLNDLVKINF